MTPHETPRGAGHRRTKPGTALLLGTLAAGLAAGLAACTTHPADAAGEPTASAPSVPNATAAAPVAVEAGPQRCGSGWSGGPAGTFTFRVTNTTTGGMDVYLADSGTDPATARVFVEIEAVGAGATANATATLSGGDYRFVCLMADEDPVLGPVQHVTGGTVDGATPGIVPITQADLIPATKAYEAWVTTHLGTLAQQVGALDADVRRGDLDAARTDWLTAHSTYGTLGGAYDAFGDLGDAIDGSPAAGRTARTDPDLTGFRRLEALLWASPGHPSGTPASALRPLTQQLVHDVADLRHDFTTAQIDPMDVGIRAHEILEDSLQVQLRGAADGASGTTLAEVAANVRGARQPLAALRPLLTERGVDLGDIDRSLDTLAATLETFDHDGRWTPRADLTTTQRERLDAQVDDALERLATVAALTDPRRAL